ncbi:Hsp70 family protein [Methylobacter sp. S3L5C]|uniref:Hsp70 family protein n=1 Tax=Methylobacter sp. S3L5C TaxID=2839024 RepID=UPI001FADF413|nr:Hsp70 family protein [Methylobacter sp. S3L5C]
MSLFGHIKKQTDNKEEAVSQKVSAIPVSEPYADDNKDSAGFGNEQFNTEPQNQQVENSVDEDFSTSASSSETDIKESSQDNVSLAPKRFSVGIDLGTTHCVLSYAEITDSDDGEFSQQVMAIPQLTSPGVVEDSFQLPSFLYQAHQAELAEGSTSLPWNAKPDYLVGEIARNLGSKTPIRLVSSAKSWLCHAGVDCKSPILPADAPDEVERISPFQATTAYLQHIRDAWQSLHPEAPLDKQDLVITVPASFDPAARELTVESARAVGLDQAILLEEPQAALYSWIEKSQGDWRKQATCGDIILVIDVGGGTTDLSLIAVTEKDGNLELTRVAVGDHILLGGDNMDLALAYTVKAKLEQDGKRLEPWQIQALTHSCRDAKEKIFNSADIDNIPLVVASRGSSLMSGNLRTELTREEVNRVLVEGFLPKVAVSERPVSRTRTGLRTTGLPYAQDAGITRHLAAFLTKQQNATDDLNDINLPEHATFLHPTAVLFNGGVLKANALAERLMEVLNSWLAAEQAPEARLLAGADLDLAVARGAAYYGFVRKGKGVRIKGGTAAAYYVSIESSMPAVPGMAPDIVALCIAPFGMEEGTREELPDDEFGLVVGEPVRFRFFASTTRRDDKVGTRLDYWTNEELSELDELDITLPEEGRRSGEVVSVHLCAAVTEVGTLELQAISLKDSSRWKIEFDVRAGD